MNYTCPHCNGSFNTTPEQAGQTIECPMCNGTMGIPALSNQTASAPPMAAQKKEPCGLATASLVCGILGIITCIPLFGLPAVICGHKANGRIKNSGGTMGGDGLALAGLITGYISMAMMVTIIPFFAAISIPAFVQYRNDTRSGLCQNNLRLINHAKEVWAVKNDKNDGDTINEQEVNTFITGGAPICPAQGEYNYNPVGTNPECSIGGEHSL
jgi:hypothetical protein